MKDMSNKPGPANVDEENLETTPLQCTICDEICFSKETLDKHYSEIHETIVEKKLKIKAIYDDLKEQLKAHTDMMYVFKICGNLTYELQDLQEHLVKYLDLAPMKIICRLPWQPVL